MLHIFFWLCLIIQFNFLKNLKVVKQFREGGYNTLVSTCVGEEGLDIGEVDLIICYDTQKSPIRLIQRMGRTGRKREGRIIILLTEGKEEQSYKTSLAKKKNIYKIIANGSKNFRFYQHNPLMVPKNLKPTCHKLFIATPTDELDAGKKNKKSKKTETEGEESPEIMTNKSKRGTKKSVLKDDDLPKPTKSRKKAKKVETSLTDESPVAPQKTKKKQVNTKSSNRSSEHDSIGPTQLPDLDFDLDGNGQIPQADKSEQIMVIDEDSKSSFPSDIIVDETMEQNYSPLLNDSSLSPIVTKKPTQQFSFSPLMSQKPNENIVGSLLDRIDSLTAANKINKTPIKFQKSQTDLDELFADEEEEDKVEILPVNFNKHETNLKNEEEKEIRPVKFQKPQTDLDELFADEDDEEEIIDSEENVEIPAMKFTKHETNLNDLFDDEEEKEISPIKFQKPQTDLDELFADEDDEEEKNNVEKSPLKFKKYETSVNELFADEEAIQVKFEKHPTDLNDLFGSDDDNNDEDEAIPVKFEKHHTDLNELFGDDDEELQSPVKFEKHETDLNELFADEDDNVKEKSEKNPIKFTKYDTNLSELFDDEEVVQNSPLKSKKFSTNEMFKKKECAKFQTFPTNVDEIFADEDEQESKSNHDLIVNDTVISDESRSSENNMFIQQCVKNTAPGILKSTSTPMDSMFKKKPVLTGNISLRKQLLIKESPLILSQLSKQAPGQTQIGLTQALDLLSTNSGCSTPDDNRSEFPKVESDELIVVEEVNNDLDSLISIDSVSAPTNHSRKRKLRFDETSIAECSYVAAKAATKPRIQTSIINLSNEADVDDDDESIIVKKSNKFKSNCCSSSEEHSSFKQSKNSTDMSDYNEVIGNNVNQSTNSSGSSSSERRYLKKFAANHTNTSEELSNESVLISIETKKVIYIHFISIQDLRIYQNCFKL